MKKKKGLPKVRRERVKLAKFKSTETLQNRDVSQLCQLFSMGQMGRGDSTPADEFRPKQNDDSEWNLALPMIGEERVKLVNFEPAKTLRNMEVRQLCQLFSMIWWASKARPTLRVLDALKDGFRGGLALAKIGGRTGEVGQVDQLRTCKNSMKQGCWSTLPTFFVNLVGLEDSTHPTGFGCNKRWLGGALPSQRLGTNR